MPENPAEITGRGESAALRDDSERLIPGRKMLAGEFDPPLHQFPHQGMAVGPLEFMAQMVVAHRKVPRHVLEEFHRGGVGPHIVARGPREARVRPRRSRQQPALGPAQQRQQQRGHAMVALDLLAQPEAFTRADPAQAQEILLQSGIHRRRQIDAGGQQFVDPRTGLDAQEVVHAAAQHRLLMQVMGGVDLDGIRREAVLLVAVEADDAGALGMEHDLEFMVVPGVDEVERHRNRITMRKAGGPMLEHFGDALDIHPGNLAAPLEKTGKNRRYISLPWMDVQVPAAQTSTPSAPPPATYVLDGGPRHLRPWLLSPSMNATVPATQAHDDSTEPAMSDRDDATVMTLVAAGDQAAMAEIYDRYAGMVLALSRRILRDPAAAEELAADIFVELWRRAAAFDARRASLATYLMTLVRSRGIDRLRSRKRQAGSPLPDDQTGPTGGDDPGARLADRERGAVVAKALAGLSTEQRAAIELAYYQGLSHVEVAERLQRPLGTVKTHIRSGLIHLRDALRMFSDGGLP